MRVFFSIQHPNLKVFNEIEVSNRTTAAELLATSYIQKLLEPLQNEFEVGVNGELLDGKYLPLPEQYRLSPDDRVEVLRELFQDPKDRRRKNITQ